MVLDIPYPRALEFITKLKVDEAQQILFEPKVLANFVAYAADPKENYTCLGNNRASKFLTSEECLFLQRFITFSETKQSWLWTLPRIQILSSVLPIFGLFECLDILTVSPGRNKDILERNIFLL